MTVFTDDVRAGSVAPERTVQQRSEALVRANAIRTYRAQMKREIKRRPGVAALVISDTPAEVESMHVLDLLLAVPKLGRVKVTGPTGILRREGISPSKTVGGLSERQRGALLSALGPYTRS